MKNTLIVVADLGCFKAFKLENNQIHRSARLALIEEFECPEAHEKLGARLTDLAGRFPRGGARAGSSAMSDGERHNLELEMRKRLVRQLAQEFNTLARREQAERVLVAASKEINHPLLEALEPQVRAKIERNIPADLTKLEPAEILRHF